MAWLLEMVMPSAVLLCVVVLQGVYGTFPPVSNPPPVPAQRVRGLDNSPQGFYLQENLPEDIPQPIVKADGLYQFDTKVDDRRWYFEENQSGERGESQSSTETFDTFYQNGEPAIGPVATPIPDDAFLAQPSTLAKLNPSDLVNLRGSDIWIVTRGSERQFVPDRWVQVQIPEERYVNVNEDSGTAVATDAVKSFVAPTVSDLPSNPQANIIQQIWVRAPNVAGPQKVISNTPTIGENAPTVKQVVDVPPSGKQYVQQQIIADVPPAPIPPPSPQIVSKKSFTAPPPLPPPLKGKGAPPAIISSGPVNVIPDSKVVISSKNVIPDSNIVANDKNVVQQLRHIWIPTSAQTGKFITIPVSPGNTGKSVADKGISLTNTPVTVSDTWVLRQNGPFPIFEKQKSSVPPPIVQNGKVIIQNTPVVQVDLPPSPPTVVQVNSPKSPPVVGKGVISNSPVDIWPLRGDLNSKTLNKSPTIVSSDIPVPSGKSDAVIGAKTAPVTPVFAQKTISNSKAPLSVPVPSPVIPLNGKPCPLPLPPQKSLLSPKNPTFISAPKSVATPVQRFPFARIIRVNRYPTGSYFLLNRNTRPSLFTYSNPTVVQQPTAGLIRLVQTRPVAVQLNNKQPIPPVQTKQIAIPVQQKIVSSVPVKQLPLPFPNRQIILPSSKASQNFYPVQGIRYAYPLNAFLKSSPIPGKGVLVPQFSSLKAVNSGSNSESSSSDSSSSSSESSSESSKEEKKGKPEKSKTEEKSKKEKLESEEKSKTEEDSKSDERERESESVSKSEETAEKPESASESESEESMEAAESLLSLSQANMDGLGPIGKPYVVRFDSRDRNVTPPNRQEVTNSDKRVTGSHGYQDPEGFYRLAKYIAGTEAFRVKLESNEPVTVTHESAHVNLISNQGTAFDDKA